MGRAARRSPRRVAASARRSGGKRKRTRRSNVTWEGADLNSGSCGFRRQAASELVCARFCPDMKRQQCAKMP